MDAVKTLITQTFFCDGTNGCACSKQQLEAGVLCVVLFETSGGAIFIQPVEPDLEHLWAGASKSNVEHMNAMEVIAEFAR